MHPRTKRGGGQKGRSVDREREREREERSKEKWRSKRRRERDQEQIRKGRCRTQRHTEKAEQRQRGRCKTQGHTEKSEQKQETVKVAKQFKANTTHANKQNRGKKAANSETLTKSQEQEST